MSTSVSRNKKRRRIHDEFGDCQPRKRFKSRRYDNHNISSNRIYFQHHNNLNEELSQSQSECDNDDGIQYQYQHQDEQRAMSQIVYHDTEEIEFEFQQCLSLYNMAPKHNKNQKRRVPLLNHTMSQIVSGRYGDRNKIHRRYRQCNKSRFIKPSQNNPWDRKLIDFLENIPSISNIQHFHQNNNNDNHRSLTPCYSDDIEQEPTSFDWIDASLAINCCVQLYVHRVNDLNDRIKKLLSSVTCTQNTKTKRKKIIENNDNNNNNICRRHKPCITTSRDINKINRIDMNEYGNIENKYMMDRFNIIRQESNNSNLLLSSTQWWLDQSAPWTTNHNQQHSNHNKDFCNMLLMDNIDGFNIDFKATHIINNEASQFLHGLNENDNHNHNECMDEVKNEEEEHIDDTTTISNNSGYDILINRNNNTSMQLMRLLPDLPNEIIPNGSCEPFNILLNNNNNNNNDDLLERIPITPIFPISPPIIGSVIEVSSSSQIQTPQKPRALIRNRVSTRSPPNQTGNIMNGDEEEKEEEKAEQEIDNDSISTFNTNNTEYSDSENNNHNNSKSRTQTVHLPPLTRLTRKICDMSLIPNMLIDEQTLDAFIIDHNISNISTPKKQKRKKSKKKKRKKTKPKNSKKKKRITPRKRSIESITNNASNSNNPSNEPSPKRRKINISPQSNDNVDDNNHNDNVCISPLNINNDNNGNIFGAGYDSLQSMGSIGSIHSVEFPRNLVENDIIYQHRMPDFRSFPGPSTYPDDYNLEMSNDVNIDYNGSNIAPSTPRTSASIPLMTPPTIHSGMSLHTISHKKSRSVLSGVMEISHNRNNNGDCLDINIDTLSPLQLPFDDNMTENVSPSPPIQLVLQQQRKQTKKKRFDGAFNGAEISKLNKCTFNIINNAPITDRNDGDDELSELRFSEFLQIQRKELCSTIPDVTIAMSFLSLLTVCSDSYHKEQHHDNVIDIDLERDNDINNNMMKTEMNDFVINIKKKSSSYRSQH